MDEQLLDFFYRWNRFEKCNAVDIIDFDLLQRSKSFSGTFSDREEVAHELDAIIRAYQGLPDKDRNSAVQAKLEASRYYLRALRGQRISFKEYVSNTMGIRPDYISRSVLQHQLSMVKQAYKKIGYTWDKKGIARFEEEHLLSKEEIEQEYATFQQKALPQIIQWLGIDIDINYTITFVDSNEYWMNWIHSDEDGRIHLRCNLNKRHKWFRGVAEFSVLHEICAHAVQISMWKEQLKRGKMHPFLGLLSVFSAEQFSLEGIAESLFYFYPENLFSDYGFASLQCDNLAWMVWNNAHIMANTDVNPAQITRFVQRYLPDLSHEVVEKNLLEKTQEPLGRTYQYVYGIALYYHLCLAKKLSNEGKKKYITESFKKIFTPDEIIHVCMI